MDTYFMNQEETENHIEQIRTPPRSTFTRPFLRVFGFLVILFALLQVLRIYAQDITAALIREAVRLNTEGRYSLQFSELQFSFFLRDIEIRELELIPDTAWKASTSTSAPLFSNDTLNHLWAGAASIRIRNFDLLNLFFHRSLAIGSLTLEEPHIRVHQRKSAERTNRSTLLNIRNPHFLIDGYLSSLDIREVTVKKGQFFWQKSATNTPPFFLDGLNLTINHLLVDTVQTAAAGVPMILKAVELELTRPFTIFKKDSSTSVHIGGLQASSSRQTLHLSDVSYKQTTYSPDQTAPNGQQVHFPDIRMKGINFWDAWLTSNLQIDTLWADSAVIALHQQADSRVSRSIKEGPHTLMAPFVTSFTIGHFRSAGTAASFSVSGQPSATLPSVTIRLDSLNIDSATFLKEMPRLWAKESYLLAEKVQIQSPDKQLTLGFERTEWASRQRNIRTEGLFVRSSGQEFYLHLPILELQQLDLATFFSQKNWQLGRLHTHSGILRWERPLRPATNSTLALPTFIMPKWLEELRIQSVELMELGLFYRHPDSSHIQAASATFQTRNLRVADGFSVKELVSQRVHQTKLYTRRLEVHLPREGHLLQADTLRLLGAIPHPKGLQHPPGEATGDLLLANLRVSPITGAATPIRARIFSNRVSIEAFNWGALLSDSTLTAHRLTVSQPVCFLRLQSPGAITPDTLEKKRNSLPFRLVQIEEVDLHQGTLQVLHPNMTSPGRLEANSVSLCLKDLVIPGALPISLQDGEFSASRLRWFLPDSLHQLELDRIFFDESSRRLLMEEVSFAPIAHSPDRVWVNFYTPRLAPSGLSLLAYHQHRLLQADSLVLPSAQLIVGLPKKEKRVAAPLQAPLQTDTTATITETFIALKDRYLRHALPSFIGGLADSVQISYAATTQQELLISVYEDRSLYVSVPWLSAEAEGLVFSSRLTAEGQLPFYSQDLRLKATDVRVKEADQYLRIGQTGFSTRSDTIWVSQISSNSQLGLMNHPHAGTGKNGYLFRAGSFSVAQAGLSEWWHHNRLHTKHLSLQKPELTLFMGQAGPAKFRPRPVKPDSLIASLQRYLYSFAIDSVQLTDGKIAFRQYEIVQPPPFSLPNRTHPLAESIYELPNGKLQFPPISLPDFITETRRDFLAGTPLPSGPFRSGEFSVYASGVAADTTDVVQKAENLFAKEWKLAVRKYDTFLPDGLYRIRFDSAWASSATKKFQLSNLSILPALNERDFFDRVGHQTDYIEAKLQTLAIEQVNWLQLLTSTGIEAKKIITDSLDLMVYRDKTRLPAQERTPAMPQEILRNLNTLLRIDTVTIGHTDIRYQEFHGYVAQKRHLMPSEAQVNLLGMRAEIRDIRNDSLFVAGGRPIFMRAEARLMHPEGALIKARFLMPLNSVNDTYYFEAELAQMDMTDLNQVLESVASVRIKSGTARRMNLRVVANNDYALGTMKFFYHNLKIRVMDGERSKVNRLEAGIISFLANNFVILSDNPRFFVPREGDVFFERDKSRFIFNYWAKIVLSGITSSIGIGKKMPPEREKERRTLFFRKRSNRYVPPAIS